MWSAVELSNDHSKWTKISSETSLQSLMGLEIAPKENDGKIYYFWDAEFPSDPDALQSIYDEMVEANGGIEMRVTVGAALTHLDSAQTSASCGGSCFCVIQGGNRRCEVCYQGGGGPVCVACGSNC